VLEVPGLRYGVERDSDRRADQPLIQGKNREFIFGIPELLNYDSWSALLSTGQCNQFFEALPVLKGTKT